MRNILADLNKHVGVIGSMVVTQDGMVVASALGRELEEDLVAAMASNVIQSTKNALEPLGGEGLSRYIMSSSHGRMMFIDIEIAFLVVVTNRNVDLGNTLVEINSTAYKITHRRTD